MSLIVIIGWAKYTSLSLRGALTCLQVHKTTGDGRPALNRHYKCVQEQQTFVETSVKTGKRNHKVFGVVSVKLWIVLTALYSRYDHQKTLSALESTGGVLNFS